MSDFIYIPVALRMNQLDAVTASNAGFRLAGDDIEAGVNLSASLVNLQRQFTGAIEGYSTNVIPAESLTDIVLFNRPSPKGDGSVVGTKARFAHKATGWKSTKITDQAIDTNFLGGGFKNDVMSPFDQHGGLSNVYDGLGLIGDKPVVLRKVSKSETENSNPSKFVSGLYGKFGNTPYVPSKLNQRLGLEDGSKLTERDIRYILWALSKMGENWHRGKSYDKPLALTLNLLNDKFGGDVAKAFAKTSKESKDEKYNYDGDDKFDGFLGVISLNLLFENIAATRK